MIGESFSNPPADSHEPSPLDVVRANRLIALFSIFLHIFPRNSLSVIFVLSVSESFSTIFGGPVSPGSHPYGGPLSLSHNENFISAPSFSIYCDYLRLAIAPNSGRTLGRLSFGRLSSILLFCIFLLHPTVRTLSGRLHSLSNRIRRIFFEFFEFLVLQNFRRLQHPERKRNLLLPLFICIQHNSK